VQDLKGLQVSPPTTSDYLVNQNPGSQAQISSRLARVIRLLLRREGRAGVPIVDSESSDCGLGVTVRELSNLKGRGLGRGRPGPGR
jgi:hypothetical protein